VALARVKTQNQQNRLVFVAAGFGLRRDVAPQAESFGHKTFALNGNSFLA
jgi:hypothetical protein